MLNKEKINNLRDELNESIENNEDYSIIYDLSVKLDKLIADYYIENTKNKGKSVIKWEKKQKNWYY